MCRNGRTECYSKMHGLKFQNYFKKLTMISITIHYEGIQVREKSEEKKGMGMGKYSHLQFEVPTAQKKAI